MEYDVIITKLQERRPFFFARVGDGEMLCMDGVPGANTDGHKYYSDLGKALRQIYSKPRQYAVGLQPKEHGLHNSGNQYPQKWVNADVLHEASIRGHLKPFFHQLKQRNIVMVGNSTHKTLPFINIMIEVPKSNAWKARREVWAAIKNTFTQHHDKNLVFLFSTGMMSGVLIDALFEIAKGTNTTAIDTGSIFEPYLGQNIRKYHKLVLEREAGLG